MKLDIKNNEVALYALGGLNEIGKNMYGVEFQDEIVLIDCGIMFPDDYLLGIDYVINDYSYLKENQEKIKGLFITHNHEDHIGGIPYFLKEVSHVPIYANKISIEMIKNKLDEHKLLRQAEFHEITEVTVVKFRKLSVEFFRITHSVAEAFGVAVNTPYGYVVETGDFKFDFTPVGEPSNLQKMARIGSDGVLALMADSTNAEIPGFTKSEAVVGQSIHKIVKNIEGRIIFASFASNLSRVQQAIDAAKENGRKIAVFGRSMVTAVEIGKQLGYIEEDDDLFVDPHHINQCRPEELMIFCTGSQGEPLAALSRIANGTHRQITIQPGDTVIFSSSPIPGNTMSVNRLIDQLLEAGAEVIHGKMNNIHTSGHGAQEELKLMLSLMKPKYFVPIHGEHRMLSIHGKMAVQTGVKEENVYIMDNGDVLAFDGKGARIAGRIQADDVYVDGSGIGDIGSVVLRDRKMLADNGLVVVVATIDAEKRELLAGPDIVSRGFIYMKESEELIKGAQKVAYDSIMNSFSYKTVNEYKMRNDLIESLKDYFYTETERRPMILPVVLS